MTVNADLFKQLLGRFATGVAVLTCPDTDGAPHGMTVSAVSSVSLSPPLLLVCVSRGATMADDLLRETYFGLNLLAEHQAKLSDYFARDTALVNTAYGLTDRRTPMLDGVTAYIECERTDVAQGGDHLVLFGSVIDGVTFERSPLIHYRGQYGTLGPRPDA